MRTDTRARHSAATGRAAATPATTAPAPEPTPPPAVIRAPRLSADQAIGLARPPKLSADMARALAENNYRQIIDVGMEQPGRWPLHHYAAPARVVYVDTCDLSRTALAAFGTAATRAFVRARPTDVPGLLRAGVEDVIEKDVPTAVILSGVLEFYDQPRVVEFLDDLRRALPAYGLIAFTHATRYLTVNNAAWGGTDHPAIWPRDVPYARAMFQRVHLDPVGPDVVPEHLWALEARPPAPLPDGASLIAGWTVPRQRPTA